MMSLFSAASSPFLDWTAFLCPWFQCCLFMMISIIIGLCLLCLLSSTCLDLPTVSWTLIQPKFQSEKLNNSYWNSTRKFFLNVQRQHIFKNGSNSFRSKKKFKQNFSSAFLFPAYFSQNNFPHISNISPNWQFPSIFFSMYESNFDERQFIVSTYQ